MSTYLEKLERVRVLKEVISTSDSEEEIKALTIQLNVLLGGMEC